MVERHSQRQEGEDEGCKGVGQALDVGLLEHGQEAGLVQEGEFGDVVLLVDGVQLLPHLLGEEAGVVQVDIGLGLDVLSQRLFALLGLWQAVLQGRVVVRVEPGLDGGGGGSSGGGAGGVGGGGGGGGGTRPLAPLPTLRTVHAWLGEVGVLDEGALDLALAADDAGQTGALLGGVGGPEGVCSGGGEGLEVWRGQRRGVDGGRRGWQLGGGGGRWVRCRGAWGEWCTAQGRACLVGHRHERARRESTVWKLLLGPGPSRLRDHNGAHRAEGNGSALQRVGPCAEPLSLVVTTRPLSIGCGNDGRALLALLQSQMVGRLLEALGTVALK